MKHFNYIYTVIVCGLLSLPAVSCIDDKGNYDYRESYQVLPVTMYLCDAAEVRVQKGERLQLTPEIWNVDREYTYCWYVTPSRNSGSQASKTILSHKRNLDTIINLYPETYLLSLEVKDESLDVYARRQVRLTVTATDIVAGFYILKEVAGETDFDYVNLNGELFADVLLNNAVPSGRLAGTPVTIAYQNDDYFHQATLPDGRDTILTKQQALFVQSSRDMKTYNARTLDLFKSYADHFYEVPEARDMRLKLTRGNAQYLVNDSLLYSINKNVLNIGRFGGYRVGSYRVHNQMINNYFNALVFDLNTSSFYYTKPTDSRLLALPEEEEGGPVGVSPDSMNATLVEMLEGDVRTVSSNTIAAGFALMRHKTEDVYYLAGISFYGENYPFTSYRTIPAGCKMPTAAARAAPYTGDFVYFGDGNKLYVYKNAEALEDHQREELLHTFPEGETIAYLNNTAAADQLIALTNSAGGWKMYVFNTVAQSNPEINPVPGTVYAGAGKAHSVMVRQSAAAR